MRLPVVWRNEAGEVELAGVTKPASSPPLQRVVATLPPELRPEQALCLPTLLGAPGDEGTEVHSTHLCAFRTAVWSLRMSRCVGSWLTSR